MTDPILPYPISVTTTTATGVCVLENLSVAPSLTNRANNKLRENVDSSKKIGFDLANLPLGYSNGEVIQIRINGIRSESAVHTVNTTKGSGKVTLSGTTSDYSGASITL